MCFNNVTERQKTPPAKDDEEVQEIQKNIK